MLPGISTYSFTWSFGVPGHPPSKPMSLVDLIDIASAHDLSIVQIADNFPLDSLSNQELRDLKSYGQKKKISFEIAAKKLTDRNLDYYLELASQMESRILRFVIDGENYEPSLQQIIQLIKNRRTEIEASGIILALENHDRLLSTDFVNIIETVSSDHVGICLDTVNSVGAGEGLIEVITHLAPYTVNLHVKEFTVTREYHKMGFKIEGLPLGKGMLPLERVVSKVADTCQTAILEQWITPEESLDMTIEKEKKWATESIIKLKEILTEHDQKLNR